MKAQNIENLVFAANPKIRDGTPQPGTQLARNIPDISMH
jgi:hypothetical protein